MGSIVDAMGDALGAFVADPVVSLLLHLAWIALVVLWLAAALWAFLDTRRRTTNPVAAYGAAGVIILATPLLFPLAILVYRSIRPNEFVADLRSDSLRVALLEIDAERPRCPECQHVVADDWLMCPNCRRALAHRCQACGGTVQLDWSVCARCAAELDGTVTGDRSRRISAPA